MESQYLVIPQNLYSLNLFIDAVPSETESSIEYDVEEQISRRQPRRKKRKQC